MKILLDRSRSGLRAVVLAFAALTAAGCSDHPLDSRAPDTAPSHNYTLPAVEGIACKHGGEYPFCRPPSTPDGMDPGTEPPPPDGGGDPGTPGPIPLIEGECPADDPDCKVALDEADKQSLAAAINAIDRNADPVCGQLADKLQSLGTAHVFRGATNSGHTGGTHGGDIHVDTRFWEAANQEGGSSIAVLAEALLHETAHLLYANHPETRSPYYTYPYSRMFSRETGAPQCVS